VGNLNPTLRLFLNNCGVLLPIVWLVCIFDCLITALALHCSAWLGMQLCCEMGAASWRPGCPYFWHAFMHWDTYPPPAASGHSTCDLTAHNILLCAIDAAFSTSALAAKVVRARDVMSSSLLLWVLPLHSLFKLEAPSFVNTITFSFPFPAIHSHLFLPFVMWAPLSATLNSLNASPSTGCDYLPDWVPELSELAHAREGA